jgi:hypothetical protein
MACETEMYLHHYMTAKNLLEDIKRLGRSDEILSAGIAALDALDDAQLTGCPDDISRHLRAKVIFNLKERVGYPV